MPDPLILTALLDEESAAFFEAMRQRHFPPPLNRVPAHLTLFHKLPGEELETITASLRALCAGSQPAVMAVTGLRFLGKGCAYTIECPQLMALHKTLATRWASWLSPQDAQKFQPHIVIQNKADPTAARALFDNLQTSFTPFIANLTGLSLWHYCGGKWERAADFPNEQSSHYIV